MIQSSAGNVSLPDLTAKWHSTQLRPSPNLSMIEPALSEPFDNSQPVEASTQKTEVSPIFDRAVGVGQPSLKPELSRETNVLHSRPDTVNTSTNSPYDFPHANAFQSAGLPESMSNFNKYILCTFFIYQ